MTIGSCRSSGFDANVETNRSTERIASCLVNEAKSAAGISDPRGCGVNYHYLTDGRLLGEDYSPCKAAHADYSAPDLSVDLMVLCLVFVKGDGLEVLYRYDGADPEAASISGFPIAPAMLGPSADHVTSISDRGAKTIFAYDGRGRPVAIARKMVKPGPAANLLADRYAPHWYVKTTAFDGPGRPVAESTGVDVAELLGTGGASVVSTEYSKRGPLKSVGGSYGALVASVTRDADGLQQITQTNMCAASPSEHRTNRCCAVSSRTRA